MSPEQAEGKPVDTRSDIFSFGSLLYEMSSGQRAFRGDSNLATLAAILEKDPAPLGADLPVELRKIIARCLRKSPDERYQHISDVRIALEEIEEDTKSRASAPTTARQPTRARWVTAAAAGLVLAALALGWWASRGVDDSEPVSLVAVPLTSESGFEESPSFSPDGTHVAYSWNGENQDNYDIYVKLIGAPKPLRLTTDPADDRNPVFSPDGRTIGFIRVSNRGRTFVVTPPIGGSERTVAELPQVVLDRAHGRAGDRPQLALRMELVVCVAARWQVRHPGRAAIVVARNWRRPRFDRWIRTACRRLVSSHRAERPTRRVCQTVRHVMSDLFVIDLADDGTPRGEPRLVALIDGDTWGLTWTADGRHVVAFQRQTVRQQRPGQDTLENRGCLRGKAGTNPAGRGRDGSRNLADRARLAFVRNIWDSNIWRATLSEAGGPPPVPARFVSSTRNDGNPQVLTRRPAPRLRIGQDRA